MNKLSSNKQIEAQKLNLNISLNSTNANEALQRLQLLEKLSHGTKKENSFIDSFDVTHNSLTNFFDERPQDKMDDAFLKDDTNGSESMVSKTEFQSQVEGRCISGLKHETPLISSIQSGASFHQDVLLDWSRITVRTLAEHLKSDENSVS